MPLEGQAAGGGAISEAQLKVFNATVLKAVEKNDWAMFDALVDWDTIEKQVTGGIQCHPEIKANYWGRVEGTLARNLVTEQHFGSLGGGCTFRRLIQGNSVSQAIYRTINRGAKGDYVALSVVIGPAGNLQIVDFGKPTVGMSFVRDNRAIFARMTAALGDSFGAIPTPPQREFIQQIHRLRELEQLVIQGNGPPALKLYQALSPDFANDNRALAFRLQAALLSEPGGKEHRAAASDVIKTAANPFTRSFVQFSYYLANGQCDKAARELVDLKKVLGPDAFLDTEMGIACVLNNVPKDGRDFAESAVRSEPDLWIGHMTLMYAAASQSDFVVAAESLKRLDELKPFSTLTTLESNPMLRTFVVSKPYQTWKAERSREKVEREQKMEREAKAIFEQYEQQKQRR